MSVAPACSPGASRPPPLRPAPLTATPLPRCVSCASNRWTCQWDLRYHECREASPNPEDSIVPAHMVRARGLGEVGPPGRSLADPDQPAPLQEDSCPQFLDPSPLVIPMNHETDVTFKGKNLDTVQMDTVKVGAGGPPWARAGQCRWAWARRACWVAVSGGLVQSRILQTWSWGARAPRLPSRHRAQCVRY